VAIGRLNRAKVSDHVALRNDCGYRILKSARPNVQGGRQLIRTPDRIPTIQQSCMNAWQARQSCRQTRSGLRWHEVADVLGAIAARPTYVDMSVPGPKRRLGDHANPDPAPRRIERARPPGLWVDRNPLTNFEYRVHFSSPRCGHRAHATNAFGLKKL
jgi:hypothetical protein